MLDRELSVKGWNYGTVNFNGSVLGFEVGKNDAFELPLGYVNQCLPGKNEVTLEFHSVRRFFCCFCTFYERSFLSE